MVAMQLAVILFCASFLILTDGQTLNLGSCPTVSVKADFDLSKVSFIFVISILAEV